MKYFDHDTTAGGDDKIISLRLECGGAAVDAYWTILEQLYRDETPLDIFTNQHLNRSVCHRLATDAETLETWIIAMLEIGLLDKTDENGGSIHSPRATENIRAYREKCETARQNGKKGGRKPTRKPKANQGGNQTLTDAETEGQAKKRKEKKELDSHKGYLNSSNAACVAATAEAAPPASPKTPKPHCPLCDVPMWRDTQIGDFHCDNCHDVFDVSKVVWR